ncbi:MAG: nodulation protein NfeD, partial [Pseudomonadota bacterium]
MTQRLSFFTSLIMIGALLSGLHFTLQAVAQNPDAARTGVILEVDGPIGPAIAEYFEEQIVEANASGADLVIVEMDTPGGLDTSMRQMIKAITASDTPVATFVTPAGARAASAGLYIMYASHIAAMSPGTNTGAATPVQVGGAPPSPEPGSNPFEAEEPAAGDGETPADDEASEDPTADGEAAAETEETATEETPALGNEDALRAKVINDAAAYIRSLADLRGRNADWGERAVRDAASLAANEALELNVIDVVATDIPDLLAQIDGRTIDINGEAVVLETEDMQLTRVEPDLLTRILAFISN